MRQKIIIIVILISVCLITNGQDSRVRLSIVLNSSEIVEVVPASLKYNKDFAFSFTLDDALLDAFDLAFRLFNGGLSPVDGITYPGLYYTDGCGNQIPFTASIAWYTANQQGVDIHNSVNTGHMTWSQALQLYHSGWTFLNHSYDHSQKGDDIDYTWQLNQNNLAFYERMGHYLNHVIPPGGNANYIQPAFDLGALAVFTSNGSYAQSSGKPIKVDGNITKDNPVFWRHHINSFDDTVEDLKSQVTELFDSSGINNHLWWNEFTHRVQYELYGGSVKFEDFKEYMEYLELSYGAKGNDRGLFANSIEVFEYLKVRDNVVIHINQNENLLEIELDYAACPQVMRYYDISLLISGADIQTIEAIDAGQVCYSNDTDYSLINIKLPASYFTGTKDLDVSDSSDWLIYPNPTQDYIIISSEKLFSDDIEISILDFAGRQIPTQVQSYGATSVRINIDKRSTKAGFFLLLAYQNGRIVLNEKIFID